MNRRNALKKTGVIAGAAILAPSLLATLQSCQNEVRSEWKPLFCNADEAEFITSFVDTILPTTDTPGGLDVKADIFIDMVIAKAYDKEGQLMMRKEIADFNAAAQEKFGAVFARLSNDDKATLLEEAESNSGKFNPSVWGTAVGDVQPVGFYRSLKSMAIWAYLTSEEIGKNVLNYDPIPGEYIGCIPVTDVGNRWTF